MKNSSSRFLCLSLLFISWVPRGGAQQAPPATPPDQAPPATQPQASGIRPAPPPIPKIPDVRQPGETGYWIGLIGWLPTEEPTMDKGHGSTFTTDSRTQLQGKPKFAEGIEGGLAIGLHNALRFSYFQATAAGNFTNQTDLQLWSQLYTAQTYLSTAYKLQNAKISFDYLTWPYPVESRKFRLKTLWQVQYTSMRTSFDAPLLPLVDSSGNPLVDSSGNPISYAGEGSKWFISPMLGLGVSEFASRHFRLEANATGFAIPHHSTVWDADASANIRYGHIEVRVGAKAFHFKTSTQADFFMFNTMAAAFVGLRWYSQ